MIGSATAAAVALMIYAIKPMQRGPKDLINTLDDHDAELLYRLDELSLDQLSPDQLSLAEPDQDQLFSYRGAATA